MPTDPQFLVERFYSELWNRADENVAREILDEDFRFRGSLGPEHRGRNGFIEYMRAIHVALADYTCLIEDIVVEKDRAAARMIFRGRHQAPFFGVAATGKIVQWAGAAFFRMGNSRISELWVLGDIDSLKRQLESGASTTFTSG